MFGALPGEVGAGVVADPANRTQIQVDVAVLACYSGAGFTDDLRAAAQSDDIRLIDLGQLYPGLTCPQGTPPRRA